MKKIVALAGGVGGAKLVLGLSKIIPQNDFSVIVNIGDDFTFSGLYVCPDLDTICYTLCGLANINTGWGRNDDSFICLNEMKKYNSETWFQLGDKDLALNLERTKLLKAGENLTSVTSRICNSLEISCRVLPASNDRVSTMIQTEEFGELPFQEYFVKYQFAPKLRNYRFEGIEKASFSHEVQKAISEADLIIICPSNPWLSIMPILKIPGFKNLLVNKIVIGVSPIVGNSALKGPAAKIFHEMGITPSAFEVARLYKDIIKGFVIDNQNKNEYSQISSWGIIPFVTDTIMVDENSKKRLAAEILKFVENSFSGR